jgi:hypothetical protein
MAENNFTIEGRAANIIKDVQRDWLFNFTFPNLAQIVNVSNAGVSLVKDLTEEITIRTRTASIPQRGQETIESNWMGFKQFFPGKPTLDNSFSIGFEESENQNMYKIMYEWQNQIFNLKSGHSKKLGKRPTNSPTSYVTDAVLSLIKYNGEVSENIILFKNVFPTSVDAVTLDYAGSGAVRYNCVFQYDLFFYGKIGQSLIEL